MLDYADIMTEYGVSREMAQIVVEYLTEASDDGSMLPMTISYLTGASKKFKFLAGEEMTMESVKKNYECLPPFQTSKYSPEQWLLAVIDILRLGDSV